MLAWKRKFLLYTRSTANNTIQQQLGHKLQEILSPIALPWVGSSHYNNKPKFFTNHSLATTTRFEENYGPMILLILPLPPLHLVMLFRFEEFTMVRMGLSSPRTLFLSLLQCCLDWKKTKGPSCPCLSPKLSLQDLFRFGAKKKGPSSHASLQALSLMQCCLDWEKTKEGPSPHCPLLKPSISLSLPLACNFVKIWRKLRSFMSLSFATPTKTLTLPLGLLLVLFLPPISLSLLPSLL